MTLPEPNPRWLVLLGPRSVDQVTRASPHNPGCSIITPREPMIVERNEYQLKAVALWPNLARLEVRGAHM